MTIYVTIKILKSIFDENFNMETVNAKKIVKYVQ
jgi:hypothetical protein